MRNVIHLPIAICALLTILASSAAAQQQTGAKLAGTLPDRDSLNSVTVTVITAPVGGPMSVMGSDMANVLDDGEKLRVLPILGKGSLQNLIDIMRLKNVDMGFVASDALELVKTEYNIPDINRSVHYIAKLFHNTVHVLARREIRTLRDLAGKRIFAERNLGYASVRIIFRRLGIEAEIDSKTDADGGLQKLLNGEADAWIVSTGKGAPVIKSIRSDGKFHLVSIPYERSLHDVYVPNSFSSDEYPNLVPPGATVDTVSASTVLMVYNWPVDSDRYRRVARFVDSLFGKLDQLQQPPRHPNWRDTALSASIPGLQRFKAAQDWLDNHKKAGVSGTMPVSEEFRRFVGPSKNRTDLSPDETARLYNDFLKWLQAKEQR
jgi:TRAP-type uncharacterized transport system substrate-binding protein